LYGNAFDACRYITRGRVWFLKIKTILGLLIGECHLEPIKVGIFKPNPLPLALVKDADCIKSIMHKAV
jgi:hypothetical protein